MIYKKVLVVLITVLSLQQVQAQKSYCLVVGTYTSGMAKGIYTYRFDAAVGEFTLLDSAISPNPSFLTVSKNEKFVYAVNQQNTDSGSAVVSFLLDKQSGGIKKIAAEKVWGAAPTHIVSDSKNKFLITSNYTGGSLSVVPVDKNGGLLPTSQIIKKEGRSIVAARQTASHVHAALFTPDEKYLLVTDLGTDKIYVYQYQSNHPQKPLIPAKDSVIVAKAGNGPRHLCFHPNKKYLYVVNELSGTIDVFAYAKNGSFTLLQTISTDSTNKADKGSADIHVSPDGKHLYVTNRGNYHTISSYAIDGKQGTLTMLQVLNTQGLTPRNFTIEPSGKYVLVANQKSDSIALFERDAKSGLLSYTGKSVKVGNPVCLVLVPMH